MRNQKLTATAIVSRSSRSYIDHVFTLNAARQPFVNVPDEAFAATLSGLDIDQCITPEDSTGWFTQKHPLIRDDRPAQITYTSGTEGKPKGIVLSYANLADAADRIIEQMGLTADVREYVGVPVTYSFGIGRIRAVSAVGGKTYLPPRGFDPAELSRMLQSDKINALSAVPTLLRVLLQSPAIIGQAGKKLRWLEIGSQYMTGAEKRAIRDLFPNARIVQHYGLTEASRTTFLQISDAPDDMLDSVGQPVGATEVEISDQGRVRIRGAHVAKWRLDGEDLVSLPDADGWLQTSDLGHITDGQLYYDGRADDLINVGGVKVNPDQLEARIGKILEQSGGITATKVPDQLRGEGVLVVSEIPGLTVEQLQTAAARSLKGLGLHAGDALHVRIVSAIPRTATGKPLRRQLTEDFIEAAKTSPAIPSEPVSARSDALDVLAFFREFFPGRRIEASDSFETMGGDSLSYIRFSLGFESRFGTLPVGWESMTVARLQTQMASQPEQASTPKKHADWRRLEAATLTRAFFMVCIVALHLDTFVYSSNWGAAYFLFMLCGYSVMRFQWPEINRTGKINTLFGTIIRVAIPTVLVVITMQVLAHTFELKPLLLISNWFDPREYQVAYYYFAEIYMQLLLVAGAIMAFPAMRNYFRKAPMLTSVVLLVISMVISAAVESVWDTNYIFHRTPIWYFWTFACGMLMASASKKDLQHRLIAMAIVTVAVLMHHHFTSASAYIVAAAALLLFWPDISVPMPVKTVLAEIAGSSMFIYLSHYQIRSLVIRLFHGPVPWLALFGAIGFGILSSHVYNWVEGKLRTFARSRGMGSIDRIPEDVI